MEGNTMKNMKKLLACLLAVLMLASCAAMFASCGEKTITVGYTIYEPMNYEENGKLVGFDTELAQRVFENLGYENIIFKEIKWENKYTELDSGNIDCIWNGFTANVADDDGVARSAKVDFSYNYMRNKQVMVVKGDKEITDAEGLKGLKVFAESGSAGEGHAKSFEGINYKGVSKQVDALMEVNAGTADVAVLDEQLAKSYCGQGNYSELKILPILGSSEEFYAIGFKKNSELTEKVNAELVKLAEEGYIKTLAEKYGVQNTAITDFSDQAK
jgi:polar amino acid transport system substrate-binding protein